MKIKLQCPKCKFEHIVTEEYLQKYGETATVCGCGEKMDVSKEETIQLCDHHWMHSHAHAKCNKCGFVKGVDLECKK